MRNQSLVFGAIIFATALPIRAESASDSQCQTCNTKTVHQVVQAELDRDAEDIYKFAASMAQDKEVFPFEMKELREKVDSYYNKFEKFLARRLLVKDNLDPGFKKILDAYFGFFVMGDDKNKTVERFFTEHFVQRVKVYLDLTFWAELAFLIYPLIGGLLFAGLVKRAPYIGMLLGWVVWFVHILIAMSL